jgi:ABC-type uncharacterized transport system substrate-binding protein
VYDDLKSLRNPQEILKFPVLENAKLPPRLVRYLRFTSLKGQRCCHRPVGYAGAGKEIIKVASEKDFGVQRWLLCVVALLIVSSGWSARSVGAADRSRPLRIGALTDSWGPTPEMVGLRDGLLALGYREPEQFVIGVRFTQGDAAALPAAARELVQLGADIIFASGMNPAKAAQMATNHLPIVFAGGGDPVGEGLIQSFARPGGNITGVTDLGLELGPKRLQVFQELIPGLQRVLFLYNASDPYSVTEAKGYRDAARRLGMELMERPVHTEAVLIEFYGGDFYPV